MADLVPALPPLAGLCSYDDAARVGFAVDESVRRLLRLHWVEKRLMEIALARLVATPEWELKCALSLHQWLDGEHAGALRARIAEMRSPPPPMDRAPDGALDAWLDELLHAADTLELTAGLHFAHAALVHAYRAHLEHTNPLVDQPTRRMLRFILLEEEETAEWYDRALAALLAARADDAARATAWQTHLAAFLDAAGGIDGSVPVPAAKLPPARATKPFVPDLRPRRDARFQGVHQFEFPPQTVYNADGVSPEERNLALLCRRALEMDVPEVMASFMTERRAQPPEFYRDYGRQLWDEARHAMMGTVALTARGIDWTRLPLHVGFSLRLNLHAAPLERQILLYAIEQSLMPGETGKRAEFETARAAGDPLSAHFHDFDWADEVLHAQIGRRWMKHEGLTVQDAVRRGADIHERTWAMLEQHAEARDADPWQWWRDLVRDVLGRDSEAAPADGVPRIVAQSG
jgi:hypothetical protein